MYKYSNIICSLILSLSFLGGCYLLAERGEEKPAPAVQEQKVSEDRSILTESELADYLGITRSELQDILELAGRRGKISMGAFMINTRFCLGWSFRTGVISF
ncbi:MAG: hypothetical protein E7E23_07670 [Paenibacillus sp.]|uniref:hypothetical protein n=1 Tax=Paenibacillus sp. TaxID=58172 RepID=UPI0028FE6D54|nr:hypothetical protein [Paenibacillus sp.]MDU2240445.1 hypothetical protein [Paenibacillus sp.]